MKDRNSVFKGNWIAWLSAVRSTVLLTGKRLRFEQNGQGTTEYAILVGVLVVIAIIAVLAFRDNLQSLWENITNSINSL